MRAMLFLSIGCSFELNSFSAVSLLTRYLGVSSLVLDTGLTISSLVCFTRLL